ncbi:MAG: ATP-binding protein [Chloroflexota bacterium]
MVYAPPGVGKSSLGFTAAAPLLLDFDRGAYRAANRGDSVQPESWGEVAGINAEDVKSYQTLVLDTAGRALDLLSVKLISENPKNGKGGGALSLAGYGELKSRFTAYLNLVRSFGLDVVLLVHMDEQRRGDDLIEHLDVQGGSKNELYKSADLMGRLRVKPRGGWQLDFSPTDTAFGKNPAGFPVLDVPDFATSPHYLGGIIADTKNALNKQSNIQQQAAKDLANWQDRIEQAESPAAFNAFIPLINAEDEGSSVNVKRLLVKLGTAKGFTFDRDLPGFKAAASAPAATSKTAVDENGWPTDSALAGAKV